jgi:Peptidase C13 family
LHRARARVGIIGHPWAAAAASSAAFPIARCLERAHAMTDSSDDDSSPIARRRLLPTLVAWWREGARTAFLRASRWQGLPATPLVTAALLTVAQLFLIGVERLYITGDATFYAPALLSGWFFTLLTLWICWVMASATSASAAARNDHARTPAALFSMLLAQVVTFDLIVGGANIVAARAGLYVHLRSSVVSWAIWLVPVAWVGVAQAKVVWQGSDRRAMWKVVASVALVATVVAAQWVRSDSYWYASPIDNVAKARFRLTPELLEDQARIPSRQLLSLSPERGGKIDLYVITYAPYCREDVFRRESAMVTDVMATRFDARGRTIQLVNNPDTARELSWATPSNLHRTIGRMGALMDRSEDVLFIHLTSHGAQDGELATSFYPLAIDSLTPAMLKSWLDEAGIRFAIISVSACYSGSWIAPLEGADRLVMTAADSDHTSYGCGSGSELTYFGRAMFDEQLRHTRSFEQAHATARQVIDERERAAGKPDGYSNPQIAMGRGMREHLTRFERELANDGSATEPAAHP